MDAGERFSEREDRDWKEHWWFPAGLGAIGLAILFATTTEGVRPSTVQIALALFGTQMLILDGMGTWQMFSYGTVQGPPERASEASARFYAWERASRRYIAAVGLSIAAAFLLPLFHTDEAQLTAILVPFLAYFVLWAIDVGRSLAEAKKLFPPPRS